MPRLIASSLAVVVLAFAATALVAAPASAAVVTVSTYAELETALAAGDSPTLSADILSPTSEPAVAAGVETLDLAGHTLTLHSLQLSAGTDLTITDSSPAGTGVLTADASNLPVAAYDESRAGIKVPATATLTIAGGTVTAKGGGQGAAGIGAQSHGGLGATLGTIEITGGVVTAQGSNAAAAIGGAAVMSGGHVIISGGEVTATSPPYGAAIGGGFFGSIDDIVISGGTVTAIATGWGAAIGGGDRSPYSSGAITISGGSVTATGLSGAGIGAGNEGVAGGTVLISGGAVDATSAGGSAIGGVGAARLASVVISGGTTNAHISTGAAAIGESDIITIDVGADVTVDAAWASALVGPSNSSVVTINGTVRLVSQQITAPVSGSFTIGSTGRLVGIGELRGTGTVTNDGAIALPSVTATTVLNHNYLVIFEPSGDTVRVYAVTFAEGDRAFPSAGPWSRIQNGTVEFTLDSALTADTTLYPAAATVLPATGLEPLPLAAAALLLLLVGLAVRMRRAH